MFTIRRLLHQLVWLSPILILALFIWCAVLSFQALDLYALNESLTSAVGSDETNSSTTTNMTISLTTRFDNFRVYVFERFTFHTLSLNELFNTSKTLTSSFATVKYKVDNVISLLDSKFPSDLNSSASFNASVYANSFGIASLNSSLGVIRTNVTSLTSRTTAVEASATSIDLRLYNAISGNSQITAKGNFYGNLFKSGLIAVKTLADNGTAISGVDFSKGVLYYESAVSTSAYFTISKDSLSNLVCPISDTIPSGCLAELFIINAGPSSISINLVTSGFAVFNAYSLSIPGARSGVIKVFTRSGAISAIFFNN